MTRIEDRASIAQIVRERPDQLAGFTVVAIDGEAGEVAGADAQQEVDDFHLAVHIGGVMGLFGRDVAIETGVITCVDPQTRAVHVDRIAEWVRTSPKVSDLAGEPV